MSSSPTPIHAATASPGLPAGLCDRLRTPMPVLGRRRALPRRSRRGLGLVDMLLAAIVVVIVIVGLLGLFRTVQNNLQNTQVSSIVTRIVSAVDRAYANRINYPNESLLATLYVSGSFTEGEIARSGTGASATYTMVTPYGTPIAVQGSGARTYSVTLSALPDHTCSRVLNPFTDRSVPVASIQVGATTLTAPYTPTAIDAACNNTTNDVVLTF